MTQRPPAKKSKKAPAVPADAESDRPTLSPPFDVEAFARASTAHDGEGADAARATQPAESPGNPGERITLTNEAELELARVKSAEGSEPPQPRTSALSIADALVPSSPPARSLSPSSLEAAVLGAIASSPAPEITERAIDDPLLEMRDRFSLGDFTGALEMAELLLAGDPDNREATECAESCRGVLEKMYAAKLGPLDRVPMVIVPRTQLRWLSIDHRAGFILSLIDGTSTVEMVLDVSGMSRVDALRILLELIQQHIVAFR